MFYLFFRDEDDLVSFDRVESPDLAQLVKQHRVVAITSPDLTTEEISAVLEQIADGVGCGEYTPVDCEDE